jgi:hypothetical protein
MPSAEQRQGHVVLGAVSRGGDGQVSRILASMFEQRLDGLVRPARRHEQHRGRVLHHGDDLEVVRLVVADSRGPGGDGERYQRGHRVAVRIAGAQTCQTGIAGCAGDVRYRDRDAELRLEQLSHLAAHEIGAAAGTEGDDQFDGAVGIILGVCGRCTDQITRSGDHCGSKCESLQGILPTCLASMSPTSQFHEEERGRMIRYCSI